jgi:eukaryotic-like serine/threonine-protein kinase
LSGDKDDPPRPDATVFNPAGHKPEPEPAEPLAEAGAPEPALGWSAEPEAQPSAWGQATTPPQPVPEPAPSAVAPTQFIPRPKSDGRLAVGAVLNNIYAIKRFIARGGMGEVYEGYNVTNPDDRVAIKVMLPALAADPNVRALFQNEAAVLIRIHHPALVPYRVAAEDPQLGVYFIVTEFVDGAPLSELLDELKPTPTELKALTRRLAEGLAAAHTVGAVHRDMSPDNVLCPGRRLELAKIVDFGIAKNLDPSKKTIVGDGFAGKLGYGAPEQFGDFDRQIGPWTDVYSLGLVILALATGRNVDMGVTMVEAVDKRRAGPDLSGAPSELRPVLQQMLAADPAKRLRSMEAVIAALDAAPPSSPPKTPKAKSAPDGRAKKSGPPLGVIVGGALGVVALAAGGLFLAGQLTPSGAPAVSGSAPSASVPRPETSAPAAVPPSAAVAGSAPAAAAQQAIAAALPGIGCSWLDLVGVTGGAGGLSVRLAGVAGQPADAQSAVAQAGSTVGAPVTDINLDEVAPVDQPVCGPLDAVRPIRDPSGGRLTTSQRRFEMVRQANGKFAGRAVITLAPGDPSIDFALVGIEPTGKMQMVIDSRAQFEAARQAAAQTSDPNISDLGGGAYRLQIDTDLAGWSGLLLITGQGPFAPQLLSGPPRARGVKWQETFHSLAERRGWKADMVWYKVVDEIPG